MGGANHGRAVAGEPRHCIKNVSAGPRRGPPERGSGAKRRPRPAAAKNRNEMHGAGVRAWDRYRWILDNHIFI